MTSSYINSVDDPKIILEKIAGYPARISDVSRLTGIHRSEIYRHLQGQSKPGMSDLERYQKALKLDWSTFVARWNSAVRSSPPLPPIEPTPAAPRARWLQEQMKSRGLSPKQMAKLLDLSVTVLEPMLRGAAPVRDSTVDRAIKALAAWDRAQVMAMPEESPKPKDNGSRAVG